jgi:hypothetical protein
MKILIQSWRFGKVVWATTWEGAPETTISELKFAACAALGKSRAHAAHMSFMSWDNAAAGRQSGQILDEFKTLADYMYADGECISVGVSSMF